MLPRTLAMLVTVVATIGAVGLTEAREGFGASTLGGDGRPVVRVTNLNDAGPGSFRDAVSAGGRTVVFDVGGDIVLSDHVYVTGALITIDGTTAPPPGITLRNRGLILRGNRGAHDVIVRALRVRGSSIDGIQIAYGAYNIVLEGLSVSGSADGNLDITESSHDITVAWSLFAEPAYPHKNSLIKYKPSRITLHHNGFIDATQRNPLISIDDVGSAAVDTTVDMRSNLVWGWGPGRGTMVSNRAQVNLVGNFYGAGPGGDAEDALIVDTATAPRVYASGNRTADGRNINVLGTETLPFPAPRVTSEEPCEAAQLVLAFAGVRPLDAVDEGYLSAIALPCAAPAPPPALSSTPTPSDDPTSPSGVTIATAVSVLAAGNDAREHISGVVKLGERYLLIGGANTVGFRFEGVAVPKGAMIESATLWLYAVAGVARSVVLRYAGEATGDSAPFRAAQWDLTLRPRTAAFVDDVPATWTPYEFNASPPVTPIVQEIVNHPAWGAGRALTIFVLDGGSLYTRMVGGYEMRPAAAAMLEVRYRTP